MTETLKTLIGKYCIWQSDDYAIKGIITNVISANFNFTGLGLKNSKCKFTRVILNKNIIVPLNSIGGPKHIHYTIKEYD